MASLTQRWPTLLHFSALLKFDFSPFVLTLVNYLPACMLVCVLLQLFALQLVTAFDFFEYAGGHTLAHSFSCETLSFLLSRYL